MCVTDVCKHTHTRAPVHTCGCVDPQGRAGSEGQGVSLIKAEEGFSVTSIGGPAGLLC